MAGTGDMLEAGPVARVYARAVVALRFVVILFWTGVALALLQLPDPGRPPEKLEGFVPAGSSAVRTESASLASFGFPLVARTVMVQHDPEGLSPYAQARAVVRAIALIQRDYPDTGPLLGGLPVTNTLALFPSSSERGTTAITFLFARPEAGLGGQTRAARRFAEQHLGPEDDYVGVSGSIPARVAQARILTEHLPTMEAVTLAVVVSIVAAYFRSLTAPLVALVTAGLGFFLAVESSALIGAALDVTVPEELEPLILALVLGIVTDYAIFFLAAMRRGLAQGVDRLAAARGAAASTGPIVAVAGLTVAAGTGVLAVADSTFFSAFGPALALAVGIAAAVSLTLVPALLAVFGRWLYWPGRPRRASVPNVVVRGARLMTRRTVAALLVGVCVVGLGWLSTAVTDLRLGVSFVPSLPQGAEARVAASAAAEGFAPGILSPTVLLLQDDDVGERRDALSRLGQALAAEPGVAGTLGPGDFTADLERPVLTSGDGSAARYLVILEHEPLGATAVETLEALGNRMPALLAEAGLDGVDHGFGGDTALAGELIDMTRQDLGRIAVAALLVNLILLVLFLRALVAPLFLLMSSVLGLLAALGALTLVFQGALGNDGITFYVPFASAVLLLSLGSDYNIFGVGYIWEKTSRMPLKQAVAEAVPESSAAITAAGVTLAASFGMLALVPLQPFRELAFVMAVGILLDAIVIRSLLVPSLLILLGRSSGWPRRMHRIPQRDPALHESLDPVSSRQEVPRE